MTDGPAVRKEECSSALGNLLGEPFGARIGTTAPTTETITLKRPPLSEIGSCEVPVGVAIG